MIADKSDSIVITFPVRFLIDLAGNCPLFYSADMIIMKGYRKLVQQIDEQIAKPDNRIWYHSMNTKPTQTIEWAFITVLGKIRWRASVIEFQDRHEKQFEDGRKKFARNWLVLANFIKAPEEIPYKGTQGFRYSEKFF